jgi:hypothetical protein
MEWLLNILKFLSGRSCGGDRMVILRLYLAFILSKVYYGIFVYCSAKNSKMSIIIPVHNIGLCLDTGSFSSRLESLKMESGESSLSVPRYLFLWNYVVWLAIAYAQSCVPGLLPLHLEFITLSVRLPDLLQRLGIYLPEIIPHNLPFF